MPLFDRRGRGLRLNRFGKTFLGHVERVFGDHVLAFFAGAPIPYAAIRNAALGPAVARKDRG